MVLVQGNIACVLRQAAQNLLGISDSPRLDAELLLCQVVQQKRSYLYAHSESIIEHTQLDQFQHLLERRHKGEPLAYITGIKEFWSLPLAINKHVLVPRPETELLVELAIACGTKAQYAKIADLGTGSGAIGLAIAHERRRWNIIASDISEAAVSVAERNGHALKLNNIEFICGDWFVPFKHQRFDLIVSNPPYIDEHDPHLLQPALLCEPYEALVSGGGGLHDIKCIVQNAPYHLLPGGYLILEHGCDQGAAVRELLSQNDFVDICTHRDLANLERVSLGRKLKEC